MRLFSFMICLLVFFTACKEEQASLNLLADTEFELSEIVLIGPSFDTTLVLSGSSLHFFACSGGDNTDNNCTAELEIESTPFQLSYQAQGESNNEAVSIRRSPSAETDDLRLSEILDVVTFNFFINDGEEVLELSCTECPTMFNGQMVNERSIRLQK
ncbi:MAG: hypothetical protein AAF828_11755 [Bacteroidota bacterium]